MQGQQISPSPVRGGEEQKINISVNSSKVIDWFAKYDHLRSHFGFIDREQMMQFIKYESEIAAKELCYSVNPIPLINPDYWIDSIKPASFFDIDPGFRILNDRIYLKLEEYDLANFVQLPDLPETKELKDNWISYLRGGRDLLIKYVQAYKDRKVNKLAWKRIEGGRKLSEQKLKALADENFELENKVREANGLPEKHYKKCTVFHNRAFQAFL